MRVVYTTSASSLHPWSLSGRGVNRYLLLLDVDIALLPVRDDEESCRDVQESLTSSRVLIFKYWHDATEALDAGRWLLFVSRCVLFEVK